MRSPRRIHHREPPVEVRSTRVRCHRTTERVDVASTTLSWTRSNAVDLGGVGRAHLALLLFSDVPHAAVTTGPRTRVVGDVETLKPTAEVALRAPLAGWADSFAEWSRRIANFSATRSD